MDLQDREEACRHILVAVGKQWGHPARWSFHVEHMGEELPGFMLSASKRVAEDRVVVQRVIFSEDEFPSRSEAKINLVERKVLGAYQKALLQIGRE
jgi:hypothetical protein